MTGSPARKEVRDFNEVNKGLSAENAVLEALRCMECVRPTCVKGCPVGIDIPAFIQQIANQDFEGAAATIKRDNMLPAICGRVCPQESQCEGSCVLAKKEKPVAIGALERFVADYEREHGMTLPEVAPPSGKRVAVVGSGPAGLTAAAELARLGHAVTVFESLHEAGGVLTYGIPNFRLPKEIVRAEIEQVKRLGVEIRLNHLVGRSLSTDELLSYDAVFLGTGAGLPYFMGIEGENLNGVYSANEFLTRVNLMHADRFPEFDTPVKRGCNVVVVGGGNVAMDAARVARRLGGKVTLVYRRREEDLPARAVEVENALAEGVQFVCCANPVRVIGEKTVQAVECVQMSMCDLDESGRPKPSCVEGSNFLIEADVFIEAIGQGPNPLLVSMLPDLKRERRGNLVVDADGQTALGRVYAGGDVATGAATVIWAMGSAKKAAAAIDRMLREE
ncbi:glutamate synthase (NADPH), homotetrameric [Methanofollis liminatans DSM 4140]|uniref:Glutamate synthase (NADPH), homotetrameric n=1 Tax=Methanofollis liminatans DSM 4140 TaxID=28892 RepID=J1L376_9EURY|nr:NADPH-dependent glutamate synthase [Methanofollis liminatans]EJG07175.1 glutamate synthase (NADPH), homotetrameric [Methanofollis liminatans DSM 4140]